MTSQGSTQDCTALVQALRRIQDITRGCVEGGRNPEDAEAYDSALTEIEGITTDVLPDEEPAAEVPS